MTVRPGEYSESVHVGLSGDPAPMNNVAAENKRQTFACQKLQSCRKERLQTKGGTAFVNPQFEVSSNPELPMISKEHQDRRSEKRLVQ
jgi:hypothetical protein